MSLKDSKGTSKARKADKDVILSELSQNSVSISPSYSSTLSDDSLTKDETSKWGLENSFCEDSYEHMLNECIVRAMKAEALKMKIELGTSLSQTSTARPHDPAAGITDTRSPK